MTTADAHKSSVKETLISIIIAFALAFVFRGFVIEAFLIPTGSMAPTLMGAHMRFTSPQSGYDWAVAPWYYIGGTSNPMELQGGQMGVESTGARVTHPPVAVHDPMTGFRLERTRVPRRWGDRIFVMKYLYSVYDPERYDVVVFKNPRDPTINYIKRLVGLPGEQIALIDGDVFRRTPRPDDPKDVTPWALPGWECAKKPERAQRAMWQQVFDSQYAPIDPARFSFRPPWQPAPGAAGWDVTGRDYQYTGQGPTTLVWDTAHPVFGRIEDSYAYNETRGNHQNGRFPVSDIALVAGVRPTGPGASVSAIVTARKHDFRARVDADGTVTLSMRPQGGPGTPNGGQDGWQELATAKREGVLTPGKVTNIEFWHVDQSLRVAIDGGEPITAAYAWSPRERLENTLGMTLEEVASTAESLIVGERYTPPSARWEFTGGPLTLYRVGLSRDIHYQAAFYNEYNDSRAAHTRGDQPAMATHPSATLTLSPDQFFVCGDNSPQSLDARLWDVPNPWVAELDDDIGVVNRDLLIGKAFFVYFPALYRRQGIPVPDFGDMRFIR
jgi:signal peptidase I